MFENRTWCYAFGLKSFYPVQSLFSHLHACNKYMSMKDSIWLIAIAYFLNLISLVLFSHKFSMKLCFDFVTFVIVVLTRYLIS